MAESSRLLRNTASRGIAASSVIALALGGVSVVGPGPLAPFAAAAEFTGGLYGEDGTGVIEKDAQMDSDLDSGTCAVISGKPSGSQAGFTWNTLEPNKTFPLEQQKDWGVDVAFDSSKDRTFTDWSWTTSGRLKMNLGPYVIPALPAGESLGNNFEPATHTADERIEVQGGGRSNHLVNLYAKMTEGKVKQFAEAGADTPVRYAWKGQYTENNPALKVTETTSNKFTAYVNPWPSENIECNPITVSWEEFENHVIVPGEKTKVGHINVPALQGEGTDDSLPRMVVEAYDGNGKYIGPASVDGDGDIYFTWPEYRGTEQADDKNINFAVHAQPRSIEQLEAAGKHNDPDGEPRVYDEVSNSLERYSKANVIDSKAFSLDDTEYHDPQYDKTDDSIISGVDSATGPLATEPQKVTFNQTPDLIKDLVKKKDDGGFEAKVTLDEKYVYDGWSVEMDDDYNVTVTAPENPRPGTFARPKVIVEYSNGSTDELELLVVVDPNNTQVTDLVRPGLTKGTIGDDLTAQVGTKSIMKGHKPVHPAKFEVDQSTVPDGWAVTVDDTGKVTAKADDTVAPGTVITPTVKATYPDDTTDEIETQFQAIVDIKIPDYDTVTNKPNAKVSLKPAVPEVGLSGNESDEAPTRYTFEDGEATKTFTSKEGKTWTARINEKTGEITTTIPKDAPEGDILDIPVLAYYSDENPQKVKGTVVVLRGEVAPVYSVESTGPNKAVNHQIDDAPEGSTYSFGTDDNGAPITSQEVDGWKYTIDPNTGIVSSTPPAGSKPGDKKTITVTVETPNGERPEVPVTTVVNLANNWEANPTYPEETVYPGESATLPVKLDKPDNVNVAKDSPYKLGDLPEGWTITIDDNGVITATAPADAEPGTQVEIPVTVTYEDGSTDTATAVVNVVDVPKQPIPFDVEYKYDDTVPAGEYRVETEGEPGEKKQNKDRTWEQTKAPVNEVVVIGTKQATATEQVEWTEPIPYSTIVRANPDLKPGEIKTVQEGKKGEASYAATFSGTNGEAKVEETKDRTEPVEEIIEYGPGIDDQTLTSTTTNPVPFNTTFVTDDTLAAGERVVEKQGVNGVDTITSTQEIKDGKPVGEPTISTERTTKPQDAVIRVGTKTTGENTETVESEIPFGVKVEFDPNMPAGTSETVTEGKPGKKTVTVERDITNSTPGEPNITEEVVEEPVDQVIKVGTKPSEASEKVTWTAQVPFEVETRPNSELKPGEIKVAQKGVPGEKTYTADFSAEGEKATVNPEEKQTKDPVNEIIEYGPAPEDTSVVTKVEKPVPFETEIVFDNELAEGEQVVDQQGELGTEVVTSTQQIVDGKPSGDPTVTTEQTKAPKNAKIRVGTKTTGENTETYKAEAPYNVVVKYDPNMPAGESKVTTPGQPGEKTVTIKRDIVNSKPGDPQITEEITKQPVDEVITVGTKPSETSEKVTWTAQVPFEVETRPNPGLKPGEIKVAQQGVPGEKTYTANFAAKGDKATVTPEEKQTKDPVNEIIEYGPAPEDTEVVTKVEKPVPFDTEIVFDDTLAEGEQVVDQQGELGTEVVTSTQQIVDGKPSGEPTVTTEQTKAPKNAKIRVGTKTAGQTVNSVESEIPFPTRIVFDPTLKPGEQKVTQEGKPGTKKVTVTQPVENSQPNGKATSTEEVLEEPTEQIIAVGTKPDEATGKVEWTAPVPFNTEVKPNPNLKPGEVKVVTEGVLGEKKYTADFSSKGDQATVTPEEKQTKEPVDALIEYGPTIADQTLTSTKTREVAFETEFVVDDTLPAGQQVVDKQGEKGEELITSTQEIKDGKPSGEPTITTEETKAPKKAVIRVGSKTDGTHVVEEKQPIPFDTKIEYDPTIPAGEYKVATPGKAGEKTVTITETIVNSKVTDTDRKEATTSEPVTQVIKVGTKQATAAEKVEWTEPIPFSTVVRPNPALKPGEVKTVQEGVNGEASYAATFTGTNGEAKVEETKDRTEPVQEIIEYGPGVEDQTLTSTTTNPVPFNTQFIVDPTLPAGEQVVDKQGVNGVDMITSTQEIKDGKPVGEPTISTERTTEPQNAVIRIGVKQEDPAPVPSPSTEPLTIELPYPVKYVFDPNLPAGEEVVDQEGTPGSKTLRPKLEMVDGKPVWTIEEVETQKPFERIVRVGTKQAETNPFTWTSEVPFNTIVRPNYDLEPGETKVIQLGENGSTKYSANPETGEVTKLEDKKPVERIVEYRPADTDEVQVTRVTRLVPFETKVVYDPDLLEGTQKVEDGEFGEEVETTTQQVKDGKPFGEPSTSTKQTREPKNAVIRIGTKKTPKDASVTELEVPPTTQLIFDPSLAPGEQVVVREGTPGTVRVTTADGETTVENIKDAIPRLVRVGAKQPDQLNWLEPLPFKVIARENPDLQAGEHKVIQEGKPGLVQHVGETATTVTEAQDYILEIGTAKEVQEKREVITEPIPFETVFVEDDTLAAGVVKVDTQGVTGAKRTTKIWEMKDGQELGDPTVTDETLREPQNLIIRVGTGKPAEDTPEDPEQPKPDTPVEDENGSSAERCVANAFAANSPLLWLLPIGLLGAIGYGVNEMYGPQINQASGALNARWEQFVRENTPDFGHGGHGIEKPEWMREMEAQANALNQQFNQRFADYGEQLRPVGIALGALAAVALTGTLIAQACREEGFDNGMTVLGSTERKLDFGASSEKEDGAQAGSSSREGGSSKK